MYCSPRSQSLPTSSDESNSPIEDRLRDLTASGWDDAEEDLPQMRGVHLLTDGIDAGLYQITVPGCDGVAISLGRSDGIEKASEIHDMVAIGLYGRSALLNFSPIRYHIDTYLNVLLNFQKLFPGNQFRTAVKRGIDAGVRMDGIRPRNHPILSTFFNGVGVARDEEAAWNPRPVARWPPFCPPWMLPQAKMKDDKELAAQAIDGSVLVRGVDGSDNNSKETTSMDEKRSLRRRRVYHVPHHGVVTHRVLDAFEPPQLVIHGTDPEESEASRKTRRGRSVKQPLRYREDIHMCLSDSEFADEGGPRKAPKIFDSKCSTPMTIPAIPVVQAALARKDSSEMRRGQNIVPVVSPTQ